MKKVGEGGRALELLAISIEWLQSDTKLLRLSGFRMSEKKPNTLAPMGKRLMLLSLSLSPSLCFSLSTSLFLPRVMILKLVAGAEES